MTAPSLFPVVSSGRVRLPNTWGDPRHQGTRAHQAQDIEAPEGSTVVAPVAGEVIRVYDHLFNARRPHPGANAHVGYGVIIEDADGWMHLFAHFQAPPSVTVGQRVAVGDVLGRVGHTGSATGPHLHYQVERPGRVRLNFRRLLLALLERARGVVATSSPSTEPEEEGPANARPFDERQQAKLDAARTRLEAAGISRSASRRSSSSHSDGAAVGDVAPSWFGRSTTPARAPSSPAAPPASDRLPVTADVPNIPGGAEPTRAAERLNERGLRMIQRWDREWAVPEELAEWNRTAATGLNARMRASFHAYGLAATHAFMNGDVHLANQLISRAVTAHRQAARDIESAVTRFRRLDLERWLTEYIEAFGGIARETASAASTAIESGARVVAQTAATVISPLVPVLAVAAFAFVAMSKKGKR
jgi:hypothetical protein